MKSSSRVLMLLSTLLVGIVILNSLPFVTKPVQFVSNATQEKLSSTPLPAGTSPATITVNGQQEGNSTCYIGATEGSSRFNVADLLDLGVNSYHIYGGMSRWEAQDDSNVYGYPTIQQIKANPNVINWKQWDAVMTNPPNGSDYSWEPTPRWQGSARTLFSELQSAHIRVILNLRNRDEQLRPSWSPNPPRTPADWNEWWEHVFATVYWLNVRNSYGVTDFEIQNEPNEYHQGWLPQASEADYYTFVKYTYDAISYVFHTFLPGRSYHIYAPASSGGTWPKDMIQTVPQYFDSMDIHVYGQFPSSVEKVHGWMNQAGYPKEPIWVTEWGTYTQSYDSEPLGINLLNNMIYGSFPGNDYVYGSTIFAMYDFSKNPIGLIDYNGYRRTDYYAVRMGIRALQGCRPTYQSISSHKSLLVITTIDQNKNIYLLVTNQSNSISYYTHVDLSALQMQSTSVMWRYDKNHMDTIVGTPSLVDGNVSFTIPSNGAVLVKFSSSV